MQASMLLAFAINSALHRLSIKTLSTVHTTTQISSGMDSQIVLGLLYCMLTNNNPSCNYVWRMFSE